MKALGILIILAIFCFGTNAASLVAGYIILPNGDTLHGQIKFGGLPAATNWEEVTFVNKEGIQKKYKAKKNEVKGYGIEVKGLKRDYLYFVLPPSSESQWFRRVIAGSEYNLYTTSEESTFGTEDPNMMSYILEKPNGDFVLLETCGICPWRKRLAAFLAHDPIAVKKVKQIKVKNLGVYLELISK